jgi:hypothetical protein
MAAEREVTVVSALLVGLACSAGWLGVARAESGALHTVAAAGLKMDVDTRWVSGGGYRPVRITVTPSGPVIADRTLTVEFCTSHFWNYSRDGDLRVVQYVEIPSGSGVVESTISVPQTAAWNRYQVNVFENGKLVPRLSPSGAGDQNNLWAWEEKCPKVLVVGDKLPDTSGLGGLLNVQDYYQYYPYAIAQSGPGGPNVPGGKMPLPTAIARPAADLPRRWIDYTNLDLVCVSVEQLAGLAERHPEALRAILEWTAGGGNLVVYGVGRDWSGLAAVESLTGLAPGREDTSISPTARGWSEPDERRFGRPLAGIGTNATSPLVTPMYTGYGVVAGGGRGTGAGTMAEALLTVEEKEEIPPEQLRSEGCLPFVFRPFNMGMIVAIADDDPFDIPARRGRLGWSWVLNTLGSKRFLWYQRHGVSPTRENPDFWTFLIPGVGLAPITGFRVLITLFVLAIGPLNYVLLRRWKSLHLLVDGAAERGGRHAGPFWLCPGGRRAGDARPGAEHHPNRPGPRRGGLLVAALVLLRPDAVWGAAVPGRRGRHPARISPRRGSNSQPGIDLGGRPATRARLAPFPHAHAVHHGPLAADEAAVGGHGDRFGARNRFRPGSRGEPPGHSDRATVGAGQERRILLGRERRDRCLGRCEGDRPRGRKKAIGIGLPPGRAGAPRRHGP